MRGIRITRPRIVAVILAAAVLLLLFFNWLAAGGETKKAWDELSVGIERYVDQIESYGEWVGLDIDLKAVARSVRQVLNGKLTPSEIFGISGTGRNVFNTLYKALGRYFMTEKDHRTVMSLTGSYRAVFILALISIIFSLFIRITGILEKLDLLMIVFVGILFSAICVISAVLTSRGVRLNITFFSVLAIVFAVPIQLIRRLPFLREDAIWSSRKENVQCPVCGSDISVMDKYCPNCGFEVSDKMLTVTCPDCGSRVPSSAGYCEYCGSELQNR